ncbi:MAG: endonuclease domain-containing protein [Hyphomonadaceae bacterium]
MSTTNKSPLRAAGRGFRGGAFQKGREVRKTRRVQIDRFHVGDTIAVARALRESMTPAETLLWNCLRRVRLSRSHFRRQTPIGEFIVDFACRAAKLVVEIDGSAHDSRDARERDAQRDTWLNDNGFRVLRFTNAEVLAGHSRVERIVVAEAEARLLRRPTP